MIIYIDTDHVLADLDRWIETKYGVTLPNAYGWDIDGAMERLGVKFSWRKDIRWDELPTTPWARELIEYFSGHGEVRLVSSHMTTERYYWLWAFCKMLGREIPIFLTPNKVELVGSNLLVDDQDYYCNLIRVPAKWWDPNFKREISYIKEAVCIL